MSNGFIQWYAVRGDIRHSKCGRFRIWKSEAVRIGRGIATPAYYNVYTIDGRGEWNFVTGKPRLKEAKRAAFDELSRQWDRCPTPGPWVVTSVEGSPDSVTVGGGDGSEVVAKIPNHWPEGTVEGNANLVAAAPDLLEALKALTEDVGVSNVFVNRRSSDKLDAAKAAIAKAKGHYVW